MKRQPKTLTQIIMITSMIIVIEFLVIKIFSWANLLSGGRYHIIEYMVVTSGVCYAVAGVFLFLKKSRLAMWSAIVNFVLQCIIVTYAVSFTDVLLFSVLIIGQLSLMKIVGDLV